MNITTFPDWLLAIPVMALFGYVIARQIHDSFHRHMDGTLARRGFFDPKQPMDHYVGPWE